jgi:hypothetical protein
MHQINLDWIDFYTIQDKYYSLTVSIECSVNKTTGVYGLSWLLLVIARYTVAALSTEEAYRTYKHLPGTIPLTL